MRKYDLFPCLGGRERRCRSLAAQSPPSPCTASPWPTNREYILVNKEHFNTKCCGSVIFWYESGSTPLTNGFGSGSGSCHFRQWPSFFKENGRKPGFSYYFCLTIEWFGAGSGSGRPKNLRIVIRNAASTGRKRFAVGRWAHRAVSTMGRQSAYHIARIEYRTLEKKQGECICHLSWRYPATLYLMVYIVKRGWACTPYPHQPGLIFPSWWNLRQKSAVATLCVLCGGSRRYG